MKLRSCVTLSVLAIALLVIFVPAWRQTASQPTRSSQPATHSNMGREKGVIKQPQVETSHAETKDVFALLISINGNGELLLSDAAGKNVGYDALTRKSFQEIEGGSYNSADDIDIDDDDDATPSATPGATPAPAATPSATPAAGQPVRAEPELKQIEVAEAHAGEYILKVSTDSPGTYSLSVTTLGVASGNQTAKQSMVDFKNVVLGDTAPHYYRITISVDPKQPLQVTRITETGKMPVPPS